ncbi:hypothetical protein [Moraxella catarrhalis]|uniref:hypothetical protein n=1 Tax=Moraxella catarrhalis TaxID=480 RepID=UPI00128CAC04|nr:hypothetical protein [Moraxella catarrhalis]MPW89888.1 hypothetical protein [Moraxella catarrhalis]
MNKKHAQQHYIDHLKRQLTLAQHMIDELKNDNHAMRLHISDLKSEISVNNQALGELAKILCELDQMIMHPNDAVMSHFIHIYRENKQGITL